MGPIGRNTHVIVYILDILDILDCLGQLYAGIVFG